MRDLRDSKLLRRLGYRAEAHVYAGEADMPHGRHYVSATDDGGAVYAVRRSGVPVLLVEAEALERYAWNGHAWPAVLSEVHPQTSHRVASGQRGNPDHILPYALRDIRSEAPKLLDQASGVALFNVQDANRLLRRYDELRAAKQAKRKEASDGR